MNLVTEALPTLALVVEPANTTPWAGQPTLAVKTSVRKTDQLALSLQIQSIIDAAPQGLLPRIDPRIAEREPNGS